MDILTHQFIFQLSLPEVEFEHFQSSVLGERFYPTHLLYNKCVGNGRGVLRAYFSL